MKFSDINEMQFWQRVLVAMIPQVGGETACKHADEYLKAMRARMTEYNKLAEMDVDK